MHTNHLLGYDVSGLSDRALDFINAASEFRFVCPATTTDQDTSESGSAGLIESKIHGNLAQCKQPKINNNFKCVQTLAVQVVQDFTSLVHCTR